MSLYNQPGSDIWWADISIPGQPRLRRSTGETSRSKAQRVHDEIKAALWNVDPALKGKTWGKAVEKWSDLGRSKSELLSLLKLSRVFKDRSLSDMRPADVEAALSFCKTSGTYNRYVAMILSVLSLSDMKFKLAKRKDKIKTREWITHEKWAKLQAELLPHMRAMATFGITTGLRQANVLGLKWDQVDLERKLVWYEAEHMKGKRAIAVPLSIGAINVLTGQIGIDKTYVFTYRGNPIKEIKTAWQAANLRAGTGRMVAGTYRGFTWHGLRHTWATWHIQNGTPLEVLQKLGGWSDLRMVLLYAHHSPGHLAQFADNTEVKHDAPSRNPDLPD